ncbi:MAG: Unknown protein [uncultured Sulfurovum sp.]|uniref:Uncharacterized protein n=1 Tax=uncultured Sulfurovum sp. TaxID=269237 RepID=A0A6S6SFU9_9BACT|nr:MAG: Unknown protein [uncultured Sulfurovum sp.]
MMAEETSTTVSDGSFVSESGANSTLNVMDISGTMDVVAIADLVLNGTVDAGEATTMTAANIMQNADMTIGATTSLTADNDIAQNANISSVGDMSVIAGNDFIMAEETSTTVSDGNFVSQSAGNTTLNVMEISKDLMVTAIKDLVLEGTVEVGDITTMTAANITQNADMTIGATTSLTADNDIAQNANISSVGDMSVTAGNDFIMAEETSTTVSDGSLVSESGTNITLNVMDVAKSMSINSNNDILLEETIAIGFDAFVVGNNIIQNAEIFIGGSSTFSANNDMNQNENITSISDMSITVGNNFIMNRGTSTVSRVGEVSLIADNDLLLSYVESRRDTVTIVATNGVILDNNRSSSVNVLATKGLYIDGKGIESSDSISTESINKFREVSIKTQTPKVTILTDSPDRQNLVRQIDNDSFVLSQENDKWSLLFVNELYVLDIDTSNLDFMTVNMDNIENREIDNGFDTQFETQFDNTVGSESNTLLDDHLSEVIEKDTELFSNELVEGLSEENNLLGEESINEYLNQQLMERVGTTSFFEVESYESFYSQLNFIYDSGIPLFDLYSTEEYEESTIVSSNVEYWIEDIAI